MAKRRARTASFNAPTPRAGANPSRRADARPARANRVLVLVFIVGTMVVLAAILVFSLAHGSGTTPVAGTPTPSTSTAGIAPEEGLGVIDQTTGSATAAKTQPRPGQLAPDFAWITPQGRTTLSALRGHPVLIEFYGVWCPSCQQAVSLLNSLRSAYRSQGLQVLAVTGSTYGKDYEHGSYATVTMADLAWYRATFSVGYEQVFDPTIRVSNLYGRGATFPTYYVIDRKGLVHYGTSLAISNQGLDAQIRKVL